MRHKSVCQSLMCSLLLSVCSMVWAQPVPMMLQPGTVVINEPVEQLSGNAAVFVQINSVKNVLSGVNDLLMSAVPEELIPEPFVPLLSQPNPLLAIVGMQGMGMPLTPEMLEQMVGLDFSGKVCLALYPRPGGVDFTLCLPVKNPTSVSGLMMNILRPQNVVKMQEKDQTIYMVQVGNHSLPDTLYVYAARNAVLVSTRVELLGQLVSGELAMTDPMLVQEIKAHVKYDFAVAVSTAIAAPFAQMLPRLRPMIDHQMTQGIGLLQTRISPEQQMQLDNQLRWKLGINSSEEFLAYVKAYLLGSIDTISQSLIDLAKQPPCVSFGLDVSGDFQTLDFRVHTNLIKADSAPLPIDMVAVRMAIEKLNLPTDYMQITGRKPRNVTSQFYVQWVGNTRKELQTQGLSTVVLDTLESCWKNKLPVQPVESLSDWTIKSGMLSLPNPDPMAFDSSLAYLRACQNMMREPFATQLRVMPRVADDAVVNLLTANAHDQTQNLQMVQDQMTKLMQSPDSQLSRTYRVLHQPLNDGITQLTSETSIHASFGLFGFNEHELVSRRFMLQEQLPKYTVLHDGTANPAILKQLGSKASTPTDPALEQLFGLVPAQTQTVELARNLKNLPGMLDSLDRIEQLLRKELDGYLAQIQAIEAMPNLTAEQKLAKMQAVNGMPPTFCSLRRDTQTHKLYATLPGGLAYPRPALAPMIRQMLGNFPDYVNKQGGMICTVHTQDGMQQVVIKQDTRLLGRLIKELGNQITKRYLKSANPMQTLKQDLLVELDGHADYDDVLVNPLWEMMLKNPDIEHGIWDTIGQMTQPRKSARVVDVYFMDTADGSLFIDKSDQLPPIVAPSGKDGVRAFVFTCGDCGDESSRFIGWLETYTHEAKKTIMTPAANQDTAMDNYELIENGHMVASPVDKRWVMVNSEAGFKIMDAVQNKCGDKAPRPCFPGR